MKNENSDAVKVSVKILGKEKLTSCCQWLNNHGEIDVLDLSKLDYYRTIGISDAGQFYVGYRITENQKWCDLVILIQEGQDYSLLAFKRVKFRWTTNDIQSLQQQVDSRVEKFALELAQVNKQVFHRHNTGFTSETVERKLNSVDTQAPSSFVDEVLEVCIQVVLSGLFAYQWKDNEVVIDF